MVELRRLTINDVHYYYIFHSFKKDGRFFKFKRYVGPEEPSHEELLNMEKQFLSEIEKDPEGLSLRTKHNIIEVLQHIMETEGYISEANFVKLSKNFDIPLVELVGVATFYSQFKLKKPGKYTISICDGTACHVKKSNELINYLEEVLDIKTGKITRDGKFGLECVNCIGACARAPAMMVNGVVYGKLDKKKVKEVIDSLK
ncbi:MAG: NAD(P)H-dependent oxidoreductase subunit E [Candidatus Nanoarchaeia archaeon]